MKIHITVNAGAGKTTLAKELGMKMCLPVFHLDQVVWQAHWEKTSPKVREKLEDNMLRKTNWIIEGVSSKVRAEADIVIFLDVPRFKCIWRCFVRNLPFLFRSRPKLLKVIRQFPTTIRIALLRECTYSNNILIVRTPSELAAVKNRILA